MSKVFKRFKDMSRYVKLYDSIVYNKLSFKNFLEGNEKTAYLFNRYSGKQIAIMFFLLRSAGYVKGSKELSDMKIFDIEEKHNIEKN